MSVHIPASFAAPGIALTTGVVVLVAAVWAATFERIDYEKSEEVHSAQKAAASIALAYDERTARMLAAAERAAEPEGPVAGVALLDGHGRVVSRKGAVLLPGEEDLAAHRQGEALRLGRAAALPDGRRAFTLSRATPKGIVAATIAADSFAAFGDEMELGAATDVELVGLDGAVRARRSATELQADRDETALLLAAGAARRGSFVSASGVPHYVSYRVLRDYPVLVAVATSAQHTLRAFRARERNYLRNAAIATGLIIAFGAALFIAWLAERVRSEYFRHLARAVPQAFWVLEPDSERVLYASPAFAEITGLGTPPAGTLWRSWKALIHPDDRPRAEAAYAELRAGRLDVEHRIQRPDGELRWVHVRGFPVREATGELLRVAGTIEDVTARKRALEQLLHQAQYDVLTDLPNRSVCFDRLAQAISQARRKGCAVAALFVDLDRFKTVNDTLGHAVGDELLRQCARRLAGSVRSGDTVARVGGDEFLVVLNELARPEDARAAAQKIIDALAVPMQIAGHEVFISVSVGISVFPADGADVERLVNNADAAMFSAKQAGRNTLRFYTAAMNERALQNLMLENDLRRALERSEFEVHFQPKQDLATGRLAGFEALLRWPHATRGLVSPSAFVPVLEDAGLIVRVGEWTLQAACRQIADWRRAGLAAVPVAVNVVARQFMHYDLLGAVERALEESGVPADLLEIEITESDAMQHPDSVVPVLRRLRALGIRIALDDFGTGYSSLAYLKRLPVDTLKIDRSFVTGLPQDPDDVPIARAIVAMGRTLGLKVLAEGVETPAQREFLKDLGCNELQGFIYSAALRGADASRFLRAQQPRSRAADRRTQAS